jgi:hypothetical protein
MTTQLPELYSQLKKLGVLAQGSSRTSAQNTRAGCELRCATLLSK